MYNKEEYFQDIKHFVRVFIHTPNMHVPFILQFKAVIHKKASSFPTYIKSHVKANEAHIYCTYNLFILPQTTISTTTTDHFYQIEMKEIIYYMTMVVTFLTWSYIHIHTNNYV